MKRTYTVDKYRGIIESIRSKIPDVTVTTDTIVGFCGETDEEFENTIRFYEEIGFDQAFMFAYSPRRLTPAFDWADDVPAEVKRARLNRLITLQQDISRAKNQTQVGRVFEVLVEGRSNNDESKIAGRTRGNKLVIFPGTLTTSRPARSSTCKPKARGCGVSKALPNARSKSLKRRAF
jgi:tRNA-2-methylthio-N6-dimethylallyladenosine synthase